MADPADLEKMGTELKCPICLSLLSSAISLPCNHSFCNLCILKSMKLDLNCPVCKVPFRRREVRSAPNMDNLVSIYKSLEVASGINIFITQSASAKMPDGQNNVEGGGISIGKETVGSSTEKLNKRKTLQCRRPRGILKTNVENSVSEEYVQPSFPAKKRIHVPQCIPSETPTRPDKHDAKQNEYTEDRNEKGSIARNEKLVFNDGEPKLSPFFWLKEKNDDDESLESSSYEQRELDKIINTPTEDVPSFSDIKDLYDQSPSKSASTGKVSKILDDFDSGMFEWTQRACSPEIYSSSMEMEVAHDDHLDAMQEENCEVISHTGAASGGEDTHLEHTRCMGYEEENAYPEMASLSSEDDKVAIVQSMRNMLNNRAKKRKRRAQGKNPNKNDGEQASTDLRKKGKSSGQRTKFDEEVPTESSEKIKGSSKRNKLQISGIAPKLGKKIFHAKRMASSDINTPYLVVEDTTPSEFVDAKVQNQGNKCMGTKAPGLSDRGSLDVDGVLKEVSTNQSKENDNLNSKIPLTSCLKADNVKLCNSEKKHGSSSERVNIKAKRNDIKGLRGGKYLKISNDNGAKSKLVEEVLECASNKADAGADDILNFTKLRTNLDTGKKVLSVSRDRLLQKCDSIPPRFKCAFCQSSINSEVSGNMMHYLNGRPLAVDFDVQPNIIHSHRNCTEWAPNVYFKDENVINLETEISRSKRIKCCCCGIKGAALGCYEKSCKKSFHLPCAKLVSECRWDDENFVMLCPLHPSSKLPKENCGSQGKGRKKSITKRESQSKQAEVMTQHIVNTSQLWKWPESHYKWVLCCSGVTDAEKEIVSTFTKLAGVLVLKTYDPSVTHVIALTDENGACRRTLKFLMGILDGKWVLKIDWVIACIKAMEPVAVEKYEISLDIHGIMDGPRLGRLRALNKQPKLFNGFTFYFTAIFMPSYKMYLQDLVAAAGGIVLQRKPVSLSTSGLPTFIIYNHECDSDSKSPCTLCHDKAEALARVTGAEVASYKWLLDSIAASKLQTLVK
ncbi:hypothetical protein GIB67_015469 [Kingdonia uniflora]|uniref:Uncharacterized protein n=1 Tax=Kingdonia uniflora TaxID=39325 RepID=A0A7J7LAB8_9MAGN|nr:hypothetical protein GIB67_015469 [Kingdonia uniflora]